MTKKIDIKEQRGPWYAKTRDILHENEYGLKLIRDEVVRPNGTEGIYDYLNGKGGVYVLPINPNGEVILISQYRYPINNYSLEVISGGVEEGESFEEAARRELLEEAGIKAIKLITLMKRSNSAPHLINSTQRLFLATGLSYGHQQLDETEKGHFKIEKMDITDAVDEVLRGSITESPSALTILLADRYIDHLLKTDGKL